MICQVETSFSQSCEINVHCYRQKIICITIIFLQDNFYTYTIANRPVNRKSVKGTYQVESDNPQSVCNVTSSTPQ